MPLFNTGGNNKDIVDAIKELKSVQQAVLLAIQGIQFNQPPLLITSPPPFNINFSPGETKEIIPASSSARRIIIKSVSGECKLLLGSSENIVNSAISVEGDRLIDERWQGQVFGYSADGAEIIINIESEGENEMVVPFNAHCELATGTNFAYDWLGGGVEKFNAVMPINSQSPGSGKILMLDSFQPAGDVILSVLPPDNGSWLDTSTDPLGFARGFVVRLINPVDLTMALISDAWKLFLPADFKRIFDRSINRKVPLTGGDTVPIPLSFNSLAIIVTTDTISHGHRGCVFSWDNTNKSIKILGY